MNQNELDGNFWQTLSRVIHHYSDHDLPAAKEFMEILLNHQSAEFFLRITEATRWSSEMIRSHFLRKHVTVPEEGSLLIDAVANLTASVGMAILVDDEVWKDDSEVAGVGPQSEAWLDVVDALLEPTPYRLKTLGANVFWIGKPENEERPKLA